MATLVTADHPLASLIHEPTPHDRCDRCQQRAVALVLVTVDNEHPLGFCGHHWRQHRDALASAFAYRTAEPTG